MSNETNPLGLKNLPSYSSSGMVPVGRRTSLIGYMTGLWGRRFFIAEESKAKMHVANRRHLLGYGWLFLNPLLSVMAYWFIFGFILKSSRGIDNFLGYLVIGVFLFQFTARCMTEGSASIRTGAAMIRGFQFPRAALPISAVYRNLLEFIPTLLVMAILLAVLPPLENITWRVFLIFPIIAAQTIFNVGLACLLARFGHKFPDLANLIPVFSRFWLYGSGVFFSIEEMLDGHPQLMMIMQLNPMHAYLTLARDALLYGAETPSWVWGVAIAWAIAMSICGFIIFWRGEEEYGRV